MSLPATDSFTRADGASLGSNWTQLLNTFGIASNKGNAQDSGNSSVVAYWNADAFGNNHYSQAVFAGFGFLGMVGPAVRVTGTTNVLASVNGYFYYGRNSPDSGGISKIVAGAETQLVTGLSGFVDGDTLKLEAVGTTLNAYKNGALHATTTDSDLASGAAGLWAYEDAPTAVTFDDWEGGNASGGGGGGATTPRMALLGAG